MIAAPLVRPLAVPLSGSLLASAGGTSGELTFPESMRGASLVLDFTSGLIATQSAAQAQAEALQPAPALLLDFTRGLLFVES